MATDITGTIDDAIAALPPEERALVALFCQWVDEELARCLVYDATTGRIMTRRQRATAAKRRARIVTAGHRAKGSRPHR